MVGMLARNSAFADYFLSYVLMRNLRVEEELMAHLFNSSEKRLARLLLSLADFARDGQKVRVAEKIDQQTLARMVGTTRGRVSHFMNGFRRLGLIEYNGGLRVHSSLINVVLSKCAAQAKLRPAAACAGRVCNIAQTGASCSAKLCD